MHSEDEKIEKAQPIQPRTTSWEEIIKILLEKNPDPMSTIINALRGHPEEIKAEYRLTTMIAVSFVLLIAAIIGITSYLVTIGKLSGETVAFIFGTAFGSIITFLYKYLSPRKEE